MQFLLHSLVGSHIISYSAVDFFSLRFALSLFLLVFSTTLSLLLAVCIRHWELGFVIMWLCIITIEFTAFQSLMRIVYVWSLYWAICTSKVSIFCLFLPFAWIRSVSLSLSLPPSISLYFYVLFASRRLFPFSTLAVSFYFALCLLLSPLFLRAPSSAFCPLAISLSEIGRSSPLQLNRKKKITCVRTRRSQIPIFH